MPRSNASNGEGERCTGLAGLGIGFVLVAAGVVVMVLGLVGPGTRYGLGVTSIVAGLALIGVEVIRLRTRQDRGLVLWTALLDTILVAAVVLAITPIAGLSRGFVDLVVQSKIRSGADWIGYGFAFTGLFLGAIFFAYAVKYYLSTVIVLITSLATGRSGANGTTATASRTAG